MRIQAIDNVSFFWFCRILLHILPRIKIRVNVSVSPLPLDFIEGGSAERRGLRLKGSVKLIGWRNKPTININKSGRLQAS